MEILKVSGVYSGYGQIGVLRNISFSIDKGEILGILGHNGMGKSTLLKTICGDLRASSGSIVFEGSAIETLPTHTRALAGIGYVPQGRQIFSNLTVAENMLMAALGARKDPNIVAKMITKFPRLAPIADRKGGVLSGGEQQILALARCLCCQPKLILLDEPTEGVQPSIRDEIVDTLLRLREEFSLTLLLVEQNVKFMGDLADRVLHMEKGELLSPNAKQTTGPVVDAESLITTLH